MLEYIYITFFAVGFPYLLRYISCMTMWLSLMLIRASLWCHSWFQPLPAYDRALVRGISFFVHHIDNAIVLIWWCYWMIRTDLNSKCEAAGCPVDMMIFVLDVDDSLVAFSDQRDVKGVSVSFNLWPLQNWWTNNDVNYTVTVSATRPLLKSFVILLAFFAFFIKHYAQSEGVIETDITARRDADNWNVSKSRFGRNFNFSWEHNKRIEFDSISIVDRFLWAGSTNCANLRSSLLFYSFYLVTDERFLGCVMCRSTPSAANCRRVLTSC